MKLYCLYDRKSGEYFAVSMYKNDVIAKRDFSGYFNFLPPTSPVRRFPGDFDVYLIADFDDRSGVITPNYQFICSLVDCDEKDSSI